jgi:hypothetical protein
VLRRCRRAALPHERDQRCYGRESHPDHDDRDGAAAPGHHPANLALTTALRERYTRLSGDPLLCPRDSDEALP